VGQGGWPPENGDGIQKKQKKVAGKATFREEPDKREREVKITSLFRNKYKRIIAAGNYP